MSTGINLREIATEALSTFPPLGSDNSAASNYAQRMLSQLLSKRQKSGNGIPQDTAQDLRAALDTEVNSLVVTPKPAPDFETEKQTTPPPQPPDSQRLTAIISDCFHTSTDGSPEHLAHLRQAALTNAENYLAATDAGWMGRRRLMRHAKQLIKNHIEQIKQVPPP